MYACFEGHETVVDTLLKHKADVNRQSQRSGNALMIASKRGYLCIINKLLESNADPMLSDYR
jgi:ankyrin repeat protein